MEVENIILSELTQSQKNMLGMYSLKEDISHKIQVSCYLYSTDPKKLNKNEGPSKEA